MAWTELPQPEVSPSVAIDATHPTAYRPREGSNWVARVLADPKWQPPSAVVAGTPPEQVQVIVARIGPSLELTNSRGLITAVSYSRCTNAFEVIRRFVTRDQSGKRLTLREREALLFALRKIGFVASESDEAFEFLKAGCDPAFSRQYLNWEYVDDDEVAKPTNQAWVAAKALEQQTEMATESIRALGLSGRPEVPAILNELRRRITADPALRRLATGVVMAAYNDSMLRTHGKDRFRDEIYLVDINYYFLPWSRTSEGQAWREWRLAVQQSAGTKK